MFLRQNVHRVLIKKNFLRIIIKKYFYATTMRPRIHYTQQSSSWRRVTRIVCANRMLRDRTLSITLTPTEWRESHPLRNEILPRGKTACEKERAELLVILIKS